MARRGAFLIAMMALLPAAASGCDFDPFGPLAAHPVEGDWYAELPNGDTLRIELHLATAIRDDLERYDVTGTGRYAPLGGPAVKLELGGSYEMRRAFLGYDWWLDLDLVLSDGTRFDFLADVNGDDMMGRLRPSGAADYGPEFYVGRTL